MKKKILGILIPIILLLSIVVPVNAMPQSSIGIDTNGDGIADIYIRVGGNGNNGGIFPQPK